MSRFRMVGVAYGVLFLAALVAFAAWNSSVIPAHAQEATPEATSTDTTPAQVEETDQDTTTQEASTFTADQAVVVTTSDGDTLNLREEASTESEVLASLPEGTFGIVIDGPIDGTGDDEDITWYEIEVDEVTGFVTSEFLGDAATEGTFDVDTTVYVNTDGLNLRGEASLDSGVLAELTRDTTATVVSGPSDADGHSWYELDVDGTNGWAVRDFLALAPSASEDESDTEATETTTEGAALTVNTDSLNVRDAAGLEGNVLETIAFGDTVTDLGTVETVDGFDWTQVETASGTQGWVASIYVTADAAATSLTVDATATINADNVNLRDSASLSGASVGTLNTGDTVTILSDSEAADDLLWYQVETADGTTGWISGEFLTV